VNALNQCESGFSDALFSQMVSELVQQFELLSTAYHAHSEAEDQIVFPMLTNRISSDAKKTFTCCSDEHERESDTFDDVARLISQLKVANPNAAAEGGLSRSEVLKDLKGKASQLKSTLLDHMWKEDTLLLPLIVKSFRPEELSNLVQHIMAIRPAETVQTILQLMAANNKKNADSLAAGPVVPAATRAKLTPPMSSSADKFSPGGESLLQSFTSGAGASSSSTSSSTSSTSGKMQGSSGRGAGRSTAGSSSALVAPEAVVMGEGHKAPTSFQRWAPEDDKLLQAAVSRHNCKNWKKIAENVPGRNGVQCYHRYGFLITFPFYCSSSHPFAMSQMASVEPWYYQR
jgi:iron-sulfur cluster repair protein YtfE (RIC family)